jgi:hypothetical protein
MIDLLIFKQSGRIERAHIVDDFDRVLPTVSAMTERDASIFASRQVPDRTPDDFMIVTPGTVDQLIGWALPIDAWTELCRKTGRGAEDHPVFTHVALPASPADEPRPPRTVVADRSPPPAMLRPRAAQLSMHAGTDVPRIGVTRTRAVRTDLRTYHIVDSALHASLYGEAVARMDARQRRRVSEGAYVDKAVLTSGDAKVTVRASSPVQALFEAFRIHRIAFRKHRYVAVEPAHLALMREQHVVEWPAMKTVEEMRETSKADEHIQLRLIG